MYDHNQTLVPESFLALHVRQGRLTTTRVDLEARYELSEDLALHIAQRLAGAVAADDETSQRTALDGTLAGLRAEPAQVTEAEARWILRRVVELCEWDVPIPEVDG